VARITALGPARLARPGPDGATPADLVRPLLQHLADVAASAEGRARRSVPVLGLHALGDQLTVLAHDVLAAAGTTAANPDALADVADRLTALRRALP